MLTRAVFVTGLYALRFPRAGALFLGVLLATLAVGASGNGASSKSATLPAELCVSGGAWIDPSSGKRLEPEAVLQSSAGRSAVLLGESHGNAEDHRWQLHTSAALHGRRSDMVLGFEMFPRSVQPALDRWVAGELEEREFLESARWDEVWGYGAEFYLPLFHFARQNRIPMVALNVNRALVGRVGREGWEAVPESEREGLSDPAPVADEYRRSLAEVYLHKGRMEKAEDDANEAEVDNVLDDREFQNFVAAQSTWDRAMAEALVGASERHGGALAVGIMGRGHVIYGHGVAHQMAALGVTDTATLLPIAVGDDCEDIEAGVADAVFLVAEPAKPAPRPLLGVRIEGGEGGVRVAGVSGESVAEQAGIQEGDVITMAAGQATTKPAELIGIIRRQAPGTWLPLEILREDETLELVAKFPSEFGGHGSE